MLTYRYNLSYLLHDLPPEVAEWYLRGRAASPASARVKMVHTFEVLGLARASTQTLAT